VKNFGRAPGLGKQDPAYVPAPERRSM
jgi:hypothetical protein